MLEAVEEGVAQFENLKQEYVKAGGPESSDSEIRSDLCRILPRKLRDLLLRYSATIVPQTAQVLLMRGSFPSISAVDKVLGRQQRRRR